MYGLLDCESFYASCERLFRPDLATCPIGVLSNNDGCLIALSKEAKAAGIKIGTPYFKHRAELEQMNTAVFSANFPLYGDISARVMHTLRAHVEQVEVYSIDEAFFCVPVNGKPPIDFITWLRHLVIQWHGVPVRIGVGATKTLAKVANHLAKQTPSGTCFLLDETAISQALAAFPVGEVWGIGRRYAERLQRNNIMTALDFRQLSSISVRRSMGVTGLRTQQELYGEPCIGLERTLPVRQSIIHSRTFPRQITELSTLLTNVREYAARAAERLREDHLRAGVLQVSLATDKHGSSYHQESMSTSLRQRSSNTVVLGGHAARLVTALVEPKQRYKRAGIALLDLSADGQPELELNEDVPPECDELWQAVDQLNYRYGRNTVHCGWRRWRPRQERLSPQYTTRREDVCLVS